MPIDETQTCVLSDTRIFPNNKDFTVVIPESCEPFSEVMGRIQCFMGQQGLSNLQYETIGSRNISFYHPPNPMESKINPSLCQTDQPEWILDFSLSCDDIENSPGDHNVIVHLCCYSNSSRGDEMIERIIGKIQGDVCRTNRRSRRRIDQKGC